MSGGEVMLILAGISGGTLFLLSPMMIVKSVLAHREKMAEIKNRSDGSPAVLEEIQKLRQEVAELRETTTHYDMSFDAALSRVEDRMALVEQEQQLARYHGSSERVEVGARRS